MPKAAIAGFNRIILKCPQCGVKGLKEMVGDGTSSRLLAHCPCGHTFKFGKMGCLAKLGLGFLFFVALSVVFSMLPQTHDEPASSKPITASAPVRNTPPPGPRNLTTPSATSAISQHAPAPKPVDSSSAQRAAIEKYPQLAVAGSEMNRKFLEAVNKAKAWETTIFQNANWPLIIADRVAPLVSVTTPTPAPADPYGDVPAASDGLLPSAAKRAIKQSLRDPESFQTRSVLPPTRAEYGGQKCWAFSVIYGAKNGFGGYTTGSAKCYMRGSVLLGIEMAP